MQSPGTAQAQTCLGGEQRPQRSASYPVPSSAAVTAVMRANRKVDTSPELRLRSALHRYGLRFRKHLRVRVRDMRATPDIVFTRQRVAVFVDGCFWHGCPDHGTQPRANAGYWASKLERNRSRDELVDERFRAAGWVVVRIWEHVPTEEAVGRVVAALQSEGVEFEPDK